MGGDRDGNPNVTAATLRYALRRQCEVALRHYLTETFKLGSELSLSTRLTRVTSELQALADASPDRSHHREDEPCRRALAAIYARLAATLKELTGGDAARHVVPPQRPYPTAGEYHADLLVIRDSLESNGAASICDERLGPLIRAVEVFGFHLASLDLRQSSDQHEAVVAELLQAARIPRDEPTAEFISAAEFMSCASMAAYRRLVHGAPGFPDYFFNTTPLREISALNIGSRPAARKASHRIEDLRAIPWGFSWGQCRLALPGWFGFGSAVRALIEAQPGALDLLSRMHRQWPFFRTLVSNMEMALAKSDLGIAGRYAELLADVDARAHVFGVIGLEWRETVDALKKISASGQLLQANPGLAHSIEHRFPYIDPLNHAQVELMRRARRNDLDGTGIQAIHLTINGVAAGLRNTG